MEKFDMDKFVKGLGNYGVQLDGKGEDTEEVENGDDQQTCDK